jgi:ribosomal protein S15P/S13E
MLQHGRSAAYRRRMAQDPDQKVEDDIEALIEREHDLRRHAEGRGLDDAELAELHRLEVRLDQLWDLLRQRRALRSAGQDVRAAHLRSEDTVEHYRQ